MKKKFPNKSKYRTRTYDKIILIITSLFIFSTLLAASANNKYVSSSPYGFKTPIQILNLRKEYAKKVNISISGVNGMIASVFVKTDYISITKDTPFYKATLPFEDGKTIYM